jgi:dCTP deaminase
VKVVVGGKLFNKAIFTNVFGDIIDPKAFEEKAFVRHKGDYCVIPPNSFLLGRSLEYFRIPREVIGIVLGKSSYARCGIVVNVTPLEPTWEGHVIIEISNTTPLPAKVYANEGIAQVIFISADEICEISYADRGGKYQGQLGITPSKVD